MKRTTLAFLTILVLASLAITVVSQQPNSPQAKLTANGFEGTGSLLTTDIPSPGVAVLRIEAEPGTPYALAMGTWFPGWFSLAGFGTFDLHTGPTLNFFVNGFDPQSAIDLIAKTDAEDGVSLIAAAMAAGQSGFGPGFQAIVLDPTQTFLVSLTAAVRFNFVTSSSGSILSGFSSSAGSSGGGIQLSGSGMSGATGNLIAEVRAPLDAIGMDTVTVLQNLTINTSAATNWRDLNNNNTSPSNFSVGDYVKIEMILDPANLEYHALQIRLEVMRPGFDVKVEAAVDGVGLNDVTLLGVPFAIVTSTDDDVPGGFTTLLAGDFVEIKANLVNGSYEAVEIHPENQAIGGAFNVAFRSRSFVDATTATSLTVLGVEIFVGPGTRFDGVSLASLSTSSYVEVRANPDASGQLFASRIKLRSPDSEVRIEGLVDFLLSPDFGIGGVTIQTNLATDWQQGLTGFGDLTLGLRVQAKGQYLGGIIVADEVEIDN